jgi:hypothetical protein
MSRTQKNMPRIVTAFEARTQLGEIMRRASGEKQERFIVGRRGEPKIIIMGFNDFMRTIAPEPRSLACDTRLFEAQQDRYAFDESDRPGDCGRTQGTGEECQAHA